ncbi:MAG: LLM class F420-dependent oxidoreductase [Actinobacteria bacterium]|nr:MAG: LLM class F420-dependent oxidoreductase [Actinomycetota bacterium]
MKFDVMTGGLPLRAMATFAEDVERAGFSGIVVTEGARTAYMGCGAAALAADIDLLTGVAVAFPRSPMVSAEIAWELAEASGGRFRLGLGTQVRAHITRRYGSEFEHPGPRLKEHVLAIQAIFRAFRGDERLAVDGDYYNLDLLPAQWSPGPIGVPDPAIDVAAVNPWMLRMAGEIADGVHVHPLNHPTYITETVIPNLRQGAAIAGRPADELEIIVPAFIVPTDDDEARWREFARMQVAFYGSTPNYSFIFDQLGFEGTTDRIRVRQKARDMAGMSAEVSDELLSHFVITGSMSELADKILERYDGLATRVVNYFGGLDWLNDPSALQKWSDVARAVTAP